MKIKYKNINLRAKSLATIETANEIISEYRADRITLTLRQLYYQFVSRDLIPNTEKSYKALGTTISNGRLAGLIDWDAIEDRARSAVSWAEYDSVAKVVEESLYSFRKPRHRGQSTIVELWVEKDALASVLQPIAGRHHITLMVNRGYSSSSAMKASADRIRYRFLEELRAGHDPSKAVILYLGDHDPSGLDMIRDVQERISLFLNEGSPGAGRPILCKVKPIALTKAQIRKYAPPPNPAKLSDSRARDYVAAHGRQSWEVDALPPRELRKIIEAELAELIDFDLIAEIKKEEEEEKAILREALDGIRAQS